MTTIYEPKGRAREYSPLALNVYSGCDHRCRYCYNRAYHGAPTATPRKGIVEALRKYLETHKVGKRVLLSFVGDIYCRSASPATTRAVLMLLQDYHVPVSILSKGGARSLRDLDLLAGMDCKLGASLTFSDPKRSMYWEPGAALPDDRCRALQEAHERGIRTWVSFEPVIYPVETMMSMENVMPYVNEIKIGKINHNKPLEDQIDWPKFLTDALALCRGRDKKIYIKESLRAVCPDVSLTPEEMDADGDGV